MAKPVSDFQARDEEFTNYLMFFTTPAWVLLLTAMGTFLLAREFFSGFSFRSRQLVPCHHIMSRPQTLSNSAVISKSSAYAGGFGINSGSSRNKTRYGPHIQYTNNPPHLFSRSSLVFKYSSCFFPRSSVITPMPQIIITIPPPNEIHSISLKCINSWK